eukprot:gene6979-8896_t
MLDGTALSDGDRLVAEVAGAMGQQLDIRSRRSPAPRGRGAVDPAGPRTTGDAVPHRARTAAAAAARDARAMNCGQSDERGAALLSVLLLVAVMAVIAATALDRLTLATRIAGSAATVDQGRAYSFAAEQIALRHVADLVGRDPAKLTLAGDWLGRDFVLPLPNGQGTARLTDASNCFNLNSLVAETIPGRFTQRPGGTGQFAELMTLLGVNADEARMVAGATADWIDSDSVDGPLGAEDGVYRSLPGSYLP